MIFWSKGRLLVLFFWSLAHNNRFITVNHRHYGSSRAFFKKQSCRAALIKNQDQNDIFFLQGLRSFLNHPMVLSAASGREEKKWNGISQQFWSFVANPWSSTNKIIIRESRGRKTVCTLSWKRPRVQSFCFFLGSLVILYLELLGLHFDGILLAD